MLWPGKRYIKCFLFYVKRLYLLRYEGCNAELPKILESHQGELRVLQTKNKSLRKSVRELNEQVKIKDEELNNVRDQNKHLLNLCKNKSLEDREKLSRKVEDLEDIVKQRDNTISTLNRKLALEAKNYKFKLSTEMSKYRSLQKELLQARSQIEDLSSLLEVKLKFLCYCLKGIQL